MYTKAIFLLISVAELAELNSTLHWGYIFLLNSTKHEIKTAHIISNAKKIKAFLLLISQIVYLLR